MARQQTRLKKKELREDPIMEAIGKAQLWLSVNGKKLAIGVVVVAAVVIAVVLLRDMRAEVDAESRKALADAQMSIQQTGGEDMITPLLQVADEYTGTSGGAEALYTAAEMALNQEENDRAIELFNRFLDEYSGEYLLTAGARGGLATAYENAGRHEEAAEIFMELANRKGGDHYRYYALLAAGRNYEAAGQNDKAREAYTTITDEVEIVKPYRTRAEEELARLSVVTDSVGLP